MDTSSSGQGGPGDHIYYGQPRSPDDLRPTCAPDDEQPSQSDQDPEPLQLAVQLKPRGQDELAGGKITRYYRFRVKDLRTAATIYKRNVPDYERPSTFFTIPATRHLVSESDEPTASTSTGPLYVTGSVRPATQSVAARHPRPSATYSNSEPIYLVSERGVSNASTSAAPFYVTAGSARRSIESVVTKFPRPSATYPNPEPVHLVSERDEPMPSTSARPMYVTAASARPLIESIVTRYPKPSATYPNPEPVYLVSERNEPMPSTPARPSYVTAGSARPAIEFAKVLPEHSVQSEPRREYPGSKTSVFKTRWLRRRLEEPLPQNTVIQPLPSTSRASSSPGPHSDTVNVSTQVDVGELGNITYEDQMEEQIESRKCKLCQATNYCRKKCSMRGKRKHGMWCLHGIVMGNEMNSSWSPRPETAGSVNLTVDQNRNHHSDILANDAYIQTSQDYSVPGTSSEVAHFSGNQDMPM